MWQNDNWNYLFYLTIKVIVIFFIWYVKNEIVDQDIGWFEFVAWDWSINFDILPLIWRNIITQGIFVTEIYIFSSHPNIRFVALIKEPTPSVVVVIFVVVRVIRRFPHRFAVVHSIPEFVFDSYFSVSAVDLEYFMTCGPWTTLLTIGNISYHFPTESFFHESTFSWLQHLVNGLDWFSKYSKYSPQIMKPTCSSFELPGIIHIAGWRFIPWLISPIGLSKSSKSALTSFSGSRDTILI